MFYKACWIQLYILYTIYFISIWHFSFKVSLLKLRHFIKKFYLSVVDRREKIKVKTLDKLFFTLAAS